MALDVTSLDKSDCVLTWRVENLRIRAFSRRRSAGIMRDAFPSKNKNKCNRIFNTTIAQHSLPTFTIQEETFDDALAFTSGLNGSRHARVLLFGCKLWVGRWQ